MLRRLLTAASVISLLLCVATAALWAVSRFRGYSVYYISGRWWDAGVVASSGKLTLRYNSFTPPSIPPYRRLRRHGPLTPTPAPAAATAVDPGIRRARALHFQQLLSPHATAGDAAVCRPAAGAF